MRKNIVITVLALSLFSSLGWNFYLQYQNSEESVDTVVRNTNGVLLYPVGTVNLEMLPALPGPAQSGPMELYQDYHHYGRQLVCGEIKSSQSARIGFETSNYVEPINRYFTNQFGTWVALVKFLEVK